MYLTWLDSNSWLIELAEQRILLDPWLVGPLTFGGQEWFFKAFRQQDRPIPDRLDVLLLSQGLPDHAHPPTLRQLDKALPVVASPNGAKVAQELGFSQVTALGHGEVFNLNGKVQIEAIPGSPIGPMLVENGYLLTDLTTGLKLYYEPHGYHAPILQQKAPVDVVITPLTSINLPLLGAFIRGMDSAVEAAAWLEPKVMLTTAAGGDIDYAGMLSTILQPEGTIADFRGLLLQKGLKTEVLEPTPGERVAVAL